MRRQAVAASSGVIVGSLGLAWVAGFAKTDSENAAGFVVDTFSRTIGLLISGIMLGFIHGKAPQVANGLALIMLATILGSRSEAIADTVGRTTGQRTKVVKKA